MLHDTTVTDHDIPLAVRDSGGAGDPVLLLHGLGGTLEAWDALGLEGHRTVAMDLRGHGRSGDGPWDWEAALDDLEAVVRCLGLGNPAVAGHSLGGMLAVQWALRHPECPAVVNLDGLRSAESDPGNYPGWTRPSGTGPWRTSKPPSTPRPRAWAGRCRPRPRRCSPPGP